MEIDRELLKKFIENKGFKENWILSFKDFLKKFFKKLSYLYKNKKKLHNFFKK